MRVFAPGDQREFGSAIAVALDRELDPLEERDYESGEHKSRPLVSLRGEDVFAIADLQGPRGTVNDRLLRHLFFLATCRDAGAARVTAVVPYLPYARKDRRTRRRDALGSRHVADLFAAMRVDRVVALDVHSLAAFENAFRCETVHLEARRLFAPRLIDAAQGLPVTGVAPDGGGMKRAEALRRRLERDGCPAALALMEKHRTRGEVSGALFAGEVDGHAAVIVDDMIGTGETVRRAAHASRRHGARRVLVAATHGLFSEGSAELLADPAIDLMLLTDSVGRAETAAREAPRRHVEVVRLAPFVAEVIVRLSADEPLDDLLDLDD